MIAIVAMSPQRVIGAEGRIPWHIPEDLKFFKRTTLGHAVLMGRKTYESIGKPLPGRENIVLSRTADFPGARMVRSLSEVAEPTDGRLLYVIGGAELYTALLPRCTELLLTRVSMDVSGDTFFPPFEPQFDEGELLETGANYEIRRHRRLA
jgi:dihydrofolate reductase